MAASSPTPLTEVETEQHTRRGLRLTQFTVAYNVRRSFRATVRAAGLDAQLWTPRELRHSFVSLLSSSGLPIEDISHLVGHANTRVTELVYRKELRPVLTKGARAMDAIFDDPAEHLGSQ